jgi:hypothetical protein
VPTASVIANNILVSARGPLITAGDVPTAMVYEKNMVFGSAAGFSNAGFEVIDPQLAANADGLFRPATDALALGWAAVAYTAATGIDGQFRAAPFDAGSEEVESGGTVLAPGAATDVGTSCSINGSVTPPSSTT